MLSFLRFYNLVLHVYDLIFILSLQYTVLYSNSSNNILVRRVNILHVYICTRTFTSIFVIFPSSHTTLEKNKSSINLTAIQLLACAGKNRFLFQKSCISGKIPNSSYIYKSWLTKKKEKEIVIVCLKIDHQVRSLMLLSITMD